MPVEEELQKYLVINTHKGLFQFSRLGFGVSSAPSIFHMDEIVKGLPNVQTFLDDHLIGGKTEEDCGLREFEKV